MVGVFAGARGTVFVEALDTARGSRQLEHEARMLREAGPTCAPRLIYEYLENGAGFLVTEAVHPVWSRPSLAPDDWAVEVLESPPQRGEAEPDNTRG